MGRFHLSVLTLLFRELVQQARFSHPHVADDDVLEDVGVVVGRGRHRERGGLDGDDTRTRRRSRCTHKGREAREGREKVARCCDFRRETTGLAMMLYKKVSNEKINLQN